MLDNPLIIAAAFTLLMGVAWRIRGGWLALPSTTLARLVPATVYAIGAYLMSDNLWHLLMGPLLFLGTIWPWGQWQDMGRVEENDDLVGMAGRGMLLCLAPGAFLALQGEAAQPGAMLWLAQASPDPGGEPSDPLPWLGLGPSHGSAGQ